MMATKSAGISIAMLEGRQPFPVLALPAIARKPGMCTRTIIVSCTRLMDGSATLFIGASKEVNQELPLVD